MSWSKVGDWVKDNAGSGVSLVGSLLTGNIPGALATGISMIQSATGTEDPKKALEILRTEPATMLKLKDLYYKNEDSIRKHIETLRLAELVDNQKAHSEQQTTVRSGDKATDEFVRRTRPLMARQSWYGTMIYIIGAELLQAFGRGSGANWELAGVLATAATAYMGARTYDKHSKNKANNL